MSQEDVTRTDEGILKAKVSGRRSSSAGRESLSIGAVSRATRIPVETIRTWEHRYGAPVAIRKPSGHRLYSADVVDHLRLVGRLLAQGHRPGEVLPLSRPELDRLLQLSESGSSTSSAPKDPASFDPGQVSGIIDRMMRATVDMDRAALMQELQSSWAALGPLNFLESVATGFMGAIGRGWCEEKLDIRHEHFASTCLADMLRHVREPFDQQARGPRIVAAMLPGDQHEVGLLMATVLMSVRGYRVIYLGRETPIDQIVAAARSGGVEAVAVGVSTASPAPHTARSIAALRKALPRRVGLWAGGAGAPISIKGVERFGSLSEFDARLR